VRYRLSFAKLSEEFLLVRRWLFLKLSSENTLLASSPSDSRVVETFLLGEVWSSNSGELCVEDILLNWFYFLSCQKYDYMHAVKQIYARILKAHSHSMSGGSIWSSLECQCCFWIAGGLVSYLTMWLLTPQAPAIQKQHWHSREAQNWTSTHWVWVSF
jgi:hypothetical protein